MFEDRLMPKNDSSTLSSFGKLLLNSTYTNSNYEKTAFMVELMLIDSEEEKKY